ncbi:MAG TPA: LytTR family DNA-binding domain-containing protein, partial [Bacteroidales bacterium]|nr:LytTR family DNA-binding domain-containing protein [Bacteroidales bacterium]
KEKVSHFILRNSLKNIETLLTNSNLVRCHRSYMINLSKVNVLRREKDGLYIELDSKSIPDIPVSKTYSNQVVQLFSEASV